MVGNAFIAVDDGWSGDAVVRLVATGTEVGRIPAIELRSALRTWGCVEDVEQLWAGTSKDKVFIYGKRGEEWTCVLRAERPKSSPDEGSPEPS